MSPFDASPSPQGLYDPAHERDACGIGMVADLNGRGRRSIVQDALQVLANLAHRGARAYDGETGDGAGILVELPDWFLREVFAALGAELPLLGHYAIGAFFLPRDCGHQARLMRHVDEMALGCGLRRVGWRAVAMDDGQLGEAARAVAPSLWQVALADAAGGRLDDLPGRRRLFLLRRRIERRFAAELYIASLSAQTLVYKAMVLPERLGLVYPDLQHERFSAAKAVVHSRFSTNTAPAWRLAQPFRSLCHNGEINTLRGNLTWMAARERELAAAIVPEGIDPAEVLPLLAGEQSDSACLDNALEALTLAGLSLAEAMTALIPEAWEKRGDWSPAQQVLRQYFDAAMEPWDGPAAVIFMEGPDAGVVVDRNGLRPCRYLVAEDGTFVVASEAGALPIAHEVLTCSGRVGPGQLLLLDQARGRLMVDQEAKEQLAQSHLADRSDWLKAHLRDFSRGPQGAVQAAALPPPTTIQGAFGYTQEEVRLVLAPMAQTGEEPVSSMGDDVPPAILSATPRPLFDYFRQQFAQVTNPPIDPLREDLVMSVTTYLGSRPPLAPPPEPTPRSPGDKGRRRLLLRLATPILSDGDLAELRRWSNRGLGVGTLSVLVPTGSGPGAFEPALIALATQAEEMVRGGNGILILSDRGVDGNHVPMPMLLAIAAVHHHLVKVGLRTQVGLVAETGAARSVHHGACLIGYGANAVNPYLALATISATAGRSVDGATATADGFGLGAEALRANYLKAMTKGLKKVLSKLGMATVSSYCGAQTFEALGLGRELVDRYFPGTSAPIGGLSLEQVANEALAAHAMAFAASGEETLPLGGIIHYRQQGERHGWTPEAIARLQHATRDGGWDDFERFCAEIDASHEEPKALRHLLLPTARRAAIPLAEVEPAATIVKRFTTGAMSLGAIGREAHETLAIAMNNIGGKSNSGEGGEDAERFHPDADGIWRNSAIKQIASGRFGVTIHYLVNAQELQIKIAQGAKPGEGGQLPGSKVDEEIARLRHATPGVQLISPPPHHDIYSIEDLAQLIHDLKNANPTARISVKLVAQTGIGAVAAGVAKAGAQKIVVSGDGGGTGASPLSSILHAGMPWEIGLAEAQQALLLHRLRDRVVLETDGQLRTPRDVMVAALLGAEEFGFATAPLVVTGCVMMRKCHLNICPVGIATQDPELRARFTGTPEAVIKYFFFVAEGVRLILASLGARSLSEVIGRTDLLRPKVASTGKASGLDLTPLLHRPTPPPIGRPRKPLDFRPTNLDAQLDKRLRDLMASGQLPARIRRRVTCADRAVGTLLSSRIARECGPAGLPSASLTLQLTGYGGQSLGAFLAPGLDVVLTGIANDYVGKGLSGGTIAIKPPLAAGLAASERDGREPSLPILAGNTLLYGATAGFLSVAGGVGERFAVRNSGACAVVEEAGDHACEYMTGGMVVILGRTGRNFAAGMSGGRAYVFDQSGTFRERCNLDLVVVRALVAGHEASQEARELRGLLVRHLELTESPRASRLLANWPLALGQFVQVIPKDLLRLDSSLAESTATASDSMPRREVANLVH